MSAELIREKMDATLEEWKGKINELKGHAQHLKAERKKDFLDKVQDMERDRTTIQSRWEATKDLGQDAWEKMKDDINKMYTEMKGKFDRTERDHDKEHTPQP
jgi:hypothetical protein